MYRRSALNSRIIMHWTATGSRTVFHRRLGKGLQRGRVDPSVTVLAATAATNSRALMRRRYRNAPRRGSSVFWRQQGRERRGETGGDLPSRGRPARLGCRAVAQGGAAVRGVGEPLRTRIL